MAFSLQSALKHAEKSNNGWRIYSNTDAKSITDFNGIFSQLLTQTFTFLAYFTCGSTKGLAETEIISLK